MDQLKGSLSDGNIGILETVNDGRSVSLNRRRVDLHHLSKGIERHVPDIVVTVRKEPAAIPVNRFQHKCGQAGMKRVLWSKFSTLRRRWRGGVGGRGKNYDELEKYDIFIINNAVGYRQVGKGYLVTERTTLRKPVLRCVEFSLVKMNVQRTRFSSSQTVPTIRFLESLRARMS